MDLLSRVGHLFTPRYSNNHKAKLLHTQSLFYFAVFLSLVQLTLTLLPTSGVKVLGYAANISTDEIIRLTNEKRSQAGVSVLKYNPRLAQAASAKAAHMIQYDYWAHVAPDGTEPWKFFTDAGYRYKYAGENLARDFTNASATVDAWMASTSHRENLLSSKYSEIGVAVTEGDLSGSDTTIVVQLFGSPLVDTTSTVNSAAAKPIATATPKPTFVPTQVPAKVITSTPIPTEAPSVTPTPEPTDTPPGAILTTLPPAETEASGFQALISPFQTTRAVSFAVTGVLLVVLVIDGIVVFRRRISRVGGRHLAHISFLAMVMAIIMIAKAGRIL